MQKIYSCFIQILIFSFIVLLSSCRFYSHNRMFATKNAVINDSIQSMLSKAEKNYVIQKNDYLEVEVYTNFGEKIIDPNNEFNKTQTVRNTLEKPKYLVRDNGFVKLPMVGDVYLEKLNLNQADSILQIAYSKFYNDAFVITKLINKRVVVIGPLIGKVIPLENENINLIEVLALHGGLTMEGKAYNIKLIRGDLKNPNVSIIDLSTIEGMQKANLDVQPNDIIYIEPVRRIISESVREISPLISVISGILTLIILFTR